MMEWMDEYTGAMNWQHLPCVGAEVHGWMFRNPGLASPAFVGDEAHGWIFLTFEEMTICILGD